MIQIVAGEIGEGKTKKLIKMANTAVKKAKGHIVYIDRSNRYMYDLNHDIRFISTNNFDLNVYKEFFGFGCGIISEDHDIEQIYFDGLLKLSNLKLDNISTVINKLDTLSNMYNINFITTVTCETKTLPESLKQFLVA